MSDPREDFTYKDLEDLDNLVEYVINFGKGGYIDESILRLLHKAKKMSITVYRGQGPNDKKILTGDEYKYYSSSALLEIAREEFSGVFIDCCVFRIHLDNIPTINVNALIKDRIGRRSEEHEYIFLGGGTFYDSEFLDTPGFYYNDEENIFECWYSFKSPPVASPPVASPPVASPPVASPPVASPPVASPTISPMPSEIRSKIIKDFIEKLEPDEYDMINSINDVMIYTNFPGFPSVTEEEATLILKELESKKEEIKAKTGTHKSSGGIKKSRKSRKSRKNRKNRKGRKSRKSRKSRKNRKTSKRSGSKTHKKK
jgi:hypothetical protein